MSRFAATARSLPLLAARVTAAVHMSVSRETYVLIDMMPGIPALHGIEAIRPLAEGVEAVIDAPLGDAHDAVARDRAVERVADRRGGDQLQVAVAEEVVLVQVPGEDRGHAVRVQQLEQGSAPLACDRHVLVAHRVGGAERVRRG